MNTRHLQVLANLLHQFCRWPGAKGWYRPPHPRVHMVRQGARLQLAAGPTSLAFFGRSCCCCCCSFVCVGWCLPLPPSAVAESVGSTSCHRLGYSLTVCGGAEAPKGLLNGLKLQYISRHILLCLVLFIVCCGSRIKHYNMTPAAVKQQKNQPSRQ
jgi:hypothetical protein